MAGGGDSGVPQRGGKKPLDTVINLVPFIDLMAVTIAFLIMTAVWTQVGRMQVSQSGGPTDPSQQRDDLPSLTMLISERQLTLTYGGTALDPIPIDPVKLDFKQLETRLKQLKHETPALSAITLQAEDAVKYDVLVRIIDTCVGAELPAVSVSPTAG